MNKRNYMLGFGLLSLLTTSCAGTNFDNTRLVVGLEADYAPFNWTAIAANDYTLPLAGINGQYADGYDVQVAKYLGEELGVPVTIKKIAWTSLIPAIKANDINVIIAGMSYTSDRDNEVDFTNAYYISDLVAVVRSDSALVTATSIQDLGGYKVVSQIGTIQDSVIEQIEDVNHLPGAESFQVGALSVSIGDADALIAEYPVARQIVNADDNLAIVEFSVGFTGFDENELSVSVAVQEGNTELVTLINTALAELTQETRVSWMDLAIERSVA